MGPNRLSISRPASSFARFCRRAILLVILAAIGIASLSPMAHAATVLAPGDIAIIGYNANDPESVSFVTFVPLEEGTQVRFKETGGATFTNTVPAGGLPAGSVIPVTAYTGWGYSSGGDSVTAFQGTSNLYFSVNASTYTIPSGLSVAAKTAIIHTPAGVDAGRYTGLRSGLKADLLTAIADAANWEHADATWYDLSVAPYSTAFTVQSSGGGGAVNWSSTVVDGRTHNGNPRPGVNLPLSASGTAVLPSIRADNADALANSACSAFPNPIANDNIAGAKWLSVYFTNTIPAGSAISLARLHVQHQGAAGKSGLFQIHVSTNLFETKWYTNVVNPSAANSGDIIWTDTEAEAIYDVTTILNTAGKVNNGEFLLLNRASSDAAVYFDYIYLEVVYVPAGGPVINNTAGASGVTASSATLNGEVTSGAPSPLVLLVWGDEIGGPVFAQWDHTVNLGTVGVGPFSSAVSGLLANKTYAYRTYASNTLGAAWAPTNAVFTTTPPTVQFSSVSTSVPEAAGTVPVTVTLSAVSALPVTVTVAVNPGGTATSGSDFAFTATTLTIPAGGLSTNAYLTMMNDAVNEADETLTLQLSNPSGATLGSAATETVTILDDDSSPTLSFSNLPYGVSESGGTASLTVSLAPTSEQAVSVAYQTQDGGALAGSDYVATNGTLTWVAGDGTSKTIQVTLINDGASEAPESFFVALSSPANAQIGGTNPVAVLVTDDDFGPSYVDNNAGASQVSSNAATLRGTLLSDGGTPATVRLYYGTTDSSTNATAWTTRLTVGVTAPGAFSQRVTGLATNTIYFYRCSASNASSVAWSDTSMTFMTGLPTVRFDSFASSNLESITPASLMVSITNPAVYGDDVTVYVAREGSGASLGNDFAMPSTTVVIRAGMTATNFDVTILNDALDEDNQSFRLRLTNAVNARIGFSPTNTFLILDDDPLPLISVLDAPYAVMENAGSITVRLQRTPVSGRTVRVSYSTVNDDAVAGLDYTAVSGDLVWNSGVTNAQSIVIPILNDAVSRGNRSFELRLTLSGTSYATFADADRQSILIIEDEASAPTVSNGDGPSDVRSGMARLQGCVLSGFPPPAARVYWGSTDGGSTPDAWAHTNELGFQESTFVSEVFSLNPRTTYYYRCFVTNSAGTDWADTSAIFMTGGARNFFVNDGDTTGDVYTTAVGDDLNSGTNAAAPKSSLQAVLNGYNLEPGDTVFVDTGLYGLTATVTVTNEDVGISGTSSNVLICGSPDPAGTVLDRANPAADVLVVGLSSPPMPVSGDAFLTLERLQVTGGRRGIRVFGNSSNRARGIRIEDCVAQGNTYISGEGTISLLYCLSPWVGNNAVYGNAGLPTAGIHLDNCTSPTVVSNSVFDNMGPGIRASSCVSPMIADNDVHNNGSYGIVVSSTSGSDQVLGNSVASNATAGLLLTARDCLVSGNTVSANGTDGMNLGGNSGSPYVITRNTVTDNGEEGIEVFSSLRVDCRNNVLANSTTYNLLFPAANNLARFENNTLYGGNGVLLPDPVAVTNRNNIIWSTGAGSFGIDVPTLSQGAYDLLSDYNTLIATDGAAVGRWGAQTCMDVSNWQTITWKDPNGTGADPCFASIMDRDFHLQSTAGSFHKGLWTPDPTNSPGIDRGDPASDYSLEPSYNGLRVELGAYGNTPEASRTAYAGALFSVALAASPALAGTTGIHPTGPLYPSNTSITVWADPANTNYAFSGWSGTYSWGARTNTFPISQNVSLTALFITRTSDTNYTGPYFTVTLATQPPQAGTASISPLLAQYPTNLPVTIWATVTNASYGWQSWTGSLQTAVNTNTFYVTANLTLTAMFAALYTNTNGVPGSWLVGYGLPNSQEGADGDTDRDGSANWEEYYADTVPTNRLSVLRASAAGRASQRDIISFLSSTSRQYRIQASTNLLMASWTNWPVSLTATGAMTLTTFSGTGTVTTVYATPPGDRRMYRIDLPYTP